MKGNEQHMLELKKNSLTSPSDWNAFYKGRELSTSFPVKPFLIELLNDYANWETQPGRIFELGCGASRILAKSGLLGWEISGIDSHKVSNKILRKFAIEHHIKIGKIIDEDILEYDCSQLPGIYDMIFSSSFLCHFNEPYTILEKWKAILKKNGVIVSSVPNLASCNAMLMKRYDFEFYNKHLFFCPEQLDEIHVNAGLSVIKPAEYIGGYYVDFYIPWNKIKRSTSAIIFKLLRYFATIVWEKLARLTPSSNNRIMNPFVIGVYRR